MIRKLVLKNFKSIKEQAFEFNKLDLIVGTNNSGKSTILQAMAIWQYCVNEFGMYGRKGSKRSGKQIILPNFTSLPLPKFNLLWTDKLSKAKDNKFIYIDIDIYWKDENYEEQNFGVRLRYHSPQSIYAIPGKNWEDFASKSDMKSFPKIVYVPPFSGLDTNEPWMDDGNIKQQVGKAQPGSVLRNLLYRVVDKGEIIKENKEWNQIEKQIQSWFGIDLIPPQYKKGIDTKILVEYKVGKRKADKFDIIAGGSGFHQILTLLAFMYGYHDVTTILFDEPDAHLHVSLQRQLINYFKKEGNKQLLIATHSEEFIKGVDVQSVLSILSGKSQRILDNNKILHALSEVDNNDVLRTKNSPYILYLEGEDDERLLSVWAEKLEYAEEYKKYYPYILGGTSKKEMKDKADKHYNALKQIIPELKRAILLDRDSDEEAINPKDNNKVLNEWKRRNIDNYLLIPDIWKRSIKDVQNCNNDLFIKNYCKTVDDYFANQNLTLPPNSTWKNVKADIFKLVDGKKLLFEKEDSLIMKLKEVSNDTLKVNRVILANNTRKEEIHQDIVNFFGNLKKIGNEE